MTFIFWYIKTLRHRHGSFNFTWYFSNRPADHWTLGHLTDGLPRCCYHSSGDRDRRIWHLLSCSEEDIISQIDDHVVAFLLVIRWGEGGDRVRGAGRMLADGLEGLTWVGGRLRLEDVLHCLLVQSLECAAYHLFLEGYLLILLSSLIERWFPAGMF